ncbi:MAG: anti-sigma factor [Cyanobacteria bacterium P01_G01_bin.49]
MTGSLPPEQLKELIAGYVLGDLSPEEAEELEQHLAENPQLAIEVNRLEEVLDLLPYALPEVEPPSHLRSTILNGTSTSLSRNPSPKRSRLSWSKIVASVAALIALALGFDNYRLRQTLQTIQTEAQQFTILTYSFQRTDAADAASAKITINPNSLEAKLKIEALPPLPVGKVYVLWTVLKPDAPYTKDDKGSVLTEVFSVDSQGSVTQTFIVPKFYRSRELVSKIAITVEDATSPQKHQGVPVLLTKL